MSKKQQVPTQCFCYGAVTCCPKFISSFHVWFRGQDAASEAHHSRNTHVSNNALGQSRPTNEGLFDDNQNFNDKEQTGRRLKKLILGDET